MGEIATRDELRELRARAMCDCKLWPKAFDAECEGNQVEWRAMAEATMKAEEAAGLAVVPLEATEEMVDAFHEYRERFTDGGMCGPISPDGTCEVMVGAGNLLTKTGE